MIAIHKLAARRRNAEEEKGFTLIELMVVVLIIAILIAIAIPTFLGARSRAQDRAAQSSLRNSLTAAKTIYTDAEAYTTADAAGMLSVEPSLTFNDGTGSTGPTNVNVYSPTPNEIYLGTQSKSGDCFWTYDDAAGTGTKYAKGTAASGGVCADTAPATPSGWTGW